MAKAPVKLVTWIFQTKPSEYLLAIVGITTLLNTLGYIGNVKTVREDGKETEARVNQLAEQAEPRAQPHEAQSAHFVQLATYRQNNCASARDEAQSYKGVSPDFLPVLYSSPSGDYVVVAIPTDDKAKAELLAQKARDLATNPRFKQNDLLNTRVRVSPGWTPLAKC